MTRRPQRTRKSAFTLIETIAAIAVLAIAVPSSLMMMNTASRARVDALQASRAQWLASGVLETVIADAASADASLGYAGVGVGGYPASLKARLDPTIGSFYSQFGLTYDVVIDPVVVSQVGGGWTAAVSPGLPSPVYRQATVTVNWALSNGAAASYSVRTIVSDL